MSAPTSAIAHGKRAGGGPADDGVDDLVGAAGVGEQLAEHRPSAISVPTLAAVLPKPLRKLVIAGSRPASRR
jgi:hypothetical protein